MLLIGRQKGHPAIKKCFSNCNRFW